ncbi:carbohydrate kinase [Microbacterium sp. M3]|uniref:Carbohydrate kinase n=1 Tax=Microbacterium arthrosphaerae TaxID=792652 RepID=A0ABU4H7S4_9MICO|nr:MULTISPECIES: carbohydrate kinase [Microbacterium]MDW4573934.1 carbohydrate kinase [Microbacterium arthrosphaerae]MDW7607789.1 carbohydrate kinase [Microbacterium sp. M3]
MLRLLVVGEALVDIVQRADGSVEEAPGGSPANTALALGRLGRRPTLLTRLGDDDRGRRVRAWLEGSDVQVVAVASPRTSTAAARLDASGAATYEFDLEWDLGANADRLEEIASTADLVHVGSVAAVLEPGAGQVAALVRSVRGRAIVTYDPNIRPSLVDDPDCVRERVAGLVQLADVVKASDEDLRWLHPGRDLVEVAREWVARGPRLVVVTLGSDGAIGVTADGEIAAPAVVTDVVDTVGAGDTFMGVLIDSIVGSDDLRASLQTAGGSIRSSVVESLLRRSADAAAITVSRPGADPPRRAELAAPATPAAAR